MGTTASSPRTRRFAVYEIDLWSAELRKNGIRIKLQKQPFQILALLSERSGELVTREELRQKLWPAHTFVDFDHSLNKAMTKLRSALNDSAESPRYIETVHRRGYRFLTPIDEHRNESAEVLVGRRVPIGPQDSVSPIITIAEARNVGRFRLWRSRGRVGWLRLLILIGATTAFSFVGALSYMRIDHSVVLGGSANTVSPRRSVAVLGFRNLSGDAQEAWLSTALSDWLTTELSAGEQLRTIPAESVARMKIELGLPNPDGLGRDTLTRIRKNLGTDLIVAGSYAMLGEKSGGQIRLDLRLQDTRNGETVDAISETGTESHLFDLVSGAGEHLRAKLGVRAVTNEEAAEVAIALPSSSEAARLHSEGLAKLRIFDALAGRDLLSKAIAAEPNYALSHAALATAWAQLGYDENAQAEAKRAFDLSSSLSRAERLLVEGRYRETSRDWEKAIEIYRALFKFFPDNLDYGLALANAEVNAGRGQEALGTIAALRDLPLPLRDDPRIDLEDSRAAESLGDFKRLQASAAKAVQKADAVGASLIAARARLDQAWALENLGRSGEAGVAAEEAQRVFAAARDTRGVAAAINRGGIALQNRGDPSGARRMYEQALAIYRQIGNRKGVADELDDIGDVLLALGELNGSRKSYEESLSTYVQIAHEDGVAHEKGALGFVLLALGDLLRAKAQFEEALVICRRIGDRAKAAIDLAGLGRALEAEGNIEDAWRYETQARAIYEEIGDQLRATETQLALAELLLDQGNTAEATVMARDAADKFVKQKVPTDESLADAVLSGAYLSQGKIADAQKAINRATVTLGKDRQKDVELFVSIMSARVRGTSSNRSNKLDAKKMLQQILAEAMRTGFVISGFEARLALGELEMDYESTTGRTRLEVLEKDAGEKGFGLIARTAGALRSGRR
jgi:DNA-binding winged helix-turn-helix (wHTH) protein/tetratricopeptide (TPR) repeat protein/TolB-like protein